MDKVAQQQAIKEDVWILTVCNICFSNCAIRVHRVDGKVVKIEGNPECPTTRGGICPKGASGIMLLYDPNRVNHPVKRTNPVKGIGVDPGWVEISWEEALDTVVEKLKKIRKEDPRKLLGGTTITLNPGPFFAHFGFMEAFGTNNGNVGTVAHCGGISHIVGGLMHSAWTRCPDPNYIQYYLNFGCPSGFGAFYSVPGMAARMADARRRGMKHVAIEPWMGMPGVNSDEWVPIRPGTDAALALSMANLLLNEYHFVDFDRIKHLTNGPYLIKADGHYLRDSLTNKPMMWDPTDNKAKVYDDPTFKDFAVEGSFEVGGVKVTPAFALVKQYVKKYTPEMASKVTSVPAATIRRLAKEFGEAAKIGSTIVIEGVELPFRPVAVGYFKGVLAHKHSALNCLALDLLQEIVGASNVPGACLGVNSRSFGHPDTHQPSYSPKAGQDGLLEVGYWLHAPGPWPVPHHAKPPESVTLRDMVPISHGAPFGPWGIKNPEKYGLNYKPEMMLRVGGNFLMSSFNPKEWENALKDVNLFTVSFSLFLDESTEFADIVLPNTCYLEQYDIHADWQSSMSPVDEWSYHMRQPVVEPMYERRNSSEVYMEIAERCGFLPEYYKALNTQFYFKDPYKLDPNKKYSWTEIVDNAYKGDFGPDHGIEWFKEHGLIHWPKQVKEVYWRPFIPARTPIYFEHLLTIGEEVERVKKEHNIDGFPTYDHQAIPDWKPCPSHVEPRPEFDLFGIYYKMPVHHCTGTGNNPWLDEVSKMDPYIFGISLNTETAKKKGLNSGDWVVMESASTGNSVEGRIVITDGIHPEVVAICGSGGHWAKGLPIASKKGKGANIEWLLGLSWDTVDGVGVNIDTCAKVKISKKG